MQNANEIAKLAITLPIRERELLVDEILRSLNEPAASDLDGAWDAEVELRLSEVDQGMDVTVPADVVLAEARKLAQ